MSITFIPKYKCILCGTPTHNSKLNFSGICVGCPKNPRRRTNREKKEPVIIQNPEKPKKSRAAFFQERWRNGHYVKPPSLKEIESKAMAGVQYENYPELERNYAP